MSHSTKVLFACCKEVLCRPYSEFCSKSGSAQIVDFIGVYLHFKSQSLRRFEYLPALVYRKNALFAEYVAELRYSLIFYLWEHLVDYEINKIVRSFLVFSRNSMCTHERRDNIKRGLS